MKHELQEKKHVRQLLLILLQQLTITKTFDQNYQDNKISYNKDILNCILKNFIHNLYQLRENII